LRASDAAGQKLFTLRLSEPAICEPWRAGAKCAEPGPGLGQDAFAPPKRTQAQSVALVLAAP